MVKRTILVVDDKKVNVLLLQKFLSEDYNVLVAHNGLDALKVVEENYNRLSAIILDIMMPVMNGYEFLRIMKKDVMYQNIPIVVSSSNAEENDEIKSFELGAQDFIAKPYHPNIIKRRLRTIIESSENTAIINRNEKDELTGIYNKQFFMESVRRIIVNNPEQVYDLICIGIERFKLVNEVYGIKKGDELLKFISQIITQEKHTIVSGRFNSDEFYMLVKHDSYNENDFKIMYEQINSFSIDLKIRLHSGIYVIGDDSLKIEEMCDRAKLAANENRGKYNLYYSLYDDKIRQKLLNDEFIVSNMENAINNEEFKVYYQPKYSLMNETLSGAEALVRWIHPTRGLISPGEFIPLLEQNGFIYKLDRFVWEKAMKDMRHWLDLGYPLVPVSVNISRADIYHSDLSDFLISLLSKYNIPIEYLHLEITESAYTVNPYQIIEVGAHLRKLGFVIEMDDFGSGYSSLNMLAEMPVDVLKMDMKFVQVQQKNESGKGVISFVISLAKWLNLSVIAEGVETQEQIDLLHSMDCNYVQGFFFAKPMAEEEFVSLLTSSEIFKPDTNEKSSIINTKNKIDVSIISNTDRVMLIVDDIEMNRAVLAEGFINEFKIVEKENGEQAWSYIQEHYEDIDIILLDLLMPVMDGFAVLDKVRNDQRTKHLPVIITSQGDAYSEERSLSLDANDFVSKPYNMEVIKHRVYNVIAGYRLFDMTREANRIDEGHKEDPILLTEITNKKYIEKYIRQQEEHFDVVRLVNPRETTVYDCSEDKPCPHHCFSVWNKNERCSNCTSLKAYQEKTRMSKLEYMDGKLYYVISEYVPYNNDGAVIEMVNKIDDQYVDALLDKTLFYANIKEISHELEIDELTGVKNRRFVNNHLLSYVTHAIRNKTDLCLAMIDIDCFKSINDTFGHLVGDDVLRSVASLIEKHISVSKGDFVSRYGGDEFIIVCSDISLDTFNKRMKDMLNLIKNLNIISREITISAGIVSLNSDLKATPIDLIKQADEKLYQAKKKGKDCIVQ